MSNTVQNTKIVTVTPEKAAGFLKKQEVLEKNDPLMRNRNVKDEKLKLYARDMAAEKWELNGEPLIFAVNGRILDGQHRLLACVESGKSFRTHIVENVPHSAMRTIDTGIIRSMGDQLTIAGHAGGSGSRLATALAVIWRWEQANHKGFMWAARPTRLEMFDVKEHHPDLERFCSKSARLVNIMSPGLGTAMWYIFSKTDELMADAFFEAVISGANLQQDDPVFLLRERLIKERRDALVKRSKPGVSMEYSAELIYRAWEATRRGVKLSKLQMGHKKSKSDETLFTKRVRKGDKKA